MAAVVTSQGTISTNSMGNSSFGITTLANVAAGSAIGVAMVALSAVNSTTVTDSASNTYTRRNTDGSTFAIYVCDSCLALSSGSTITVAGATNQVMASAVSISGLTATPRDDANGTAGSSSSPTITTATLAQANEVVLPFIYWAGSATYTEATGFSTINGTSSTLSGTLKIQAASKTVSATTAVTFNPTLSLSSSWEIEYITFKIAAVTAIGGYNKAARFEYLCE